MIIDKKDICIIILSVMLLVCLLVIGGQHEKIQTLESEEEMQTANLFNMTGPHSNLRIIENVSEQVFKIKRPPHYIGTRFNSRYRLIKYKEKESNAIRIY